MVNNTPRSIVELDDLERAADELRQIGAMSSESARREAIAKISTSALLDIAASLRVIAAEAELAMIGPVDFSEAAPDELDGISDHDRDFLVVGDRVAPDDTAELGTVTKLGTSEDELFADVELDNEGGIARYFVSHLTRVIDEPKGESDAGEGDGSDDVEDDFTPPASALDALREVEKKAAKKGKKR